MSKIKIKNPRNVVSRIVVLTFKDGKHRVLRDKFQWVLEEKSGVGWKNYGYYTNLSLLFDGVAELEFRINTGVLKDIKELEKSIDKVYKLIDTNLEPLESVLEDVGAKLEEYFAITRKQFGNLPPRKK